LVDGLFDGVLLGTAVDGLLDGDKLGLIDGLFDGVLLGTAVDGLLDGDKLGLIDGMFEGVSLGTVADGLLEGAVDTEGVAVVVHVCSKLFNTVQNLFRSSPVKPSGYKK